MPAAEPGAPLAGVRVVDLTRLLPGAFATSLLVGLGADVVKVEDPRGGDGLRVTPPFTESGESGVFVALCHGKRSVTLDLKSAAGREAFLALVASADVLLDSFRPGVLDRLGLGAEALAAANGALVHVSLTAYGDGGRAALPGHDLNALSYAGVLGLSRGPDGMPPLPPVPVADFATGLHAALAAVSGLRSAAGGTGFRADVTMVDSALSFTPMAQGAVVATGAPPPVPDALTGGLGCYGVYRCADGLELAVGALEPQFFARIAELVGEPDLAAAQYDVAGQDALHGRLVALFAGRPRQDWLDLLEHDHTCVSPVRTVADALADPDLRARGVTVDVPLADGSTAVVGRSAAWAPAPPAPSRAPGLGEHTDEVLGALGVDLAALRAAGATA
ncbi:MAG: CoA transferase [Frankiales bacterium]|nr:CoA transferase [Frankiales bacterium]